MKADTESLLFSANRLSLLSRLDRRAVEKRLMHLGPAKVTGKTRLYRLSEALPLLVQAEENAAIENRILSDRAREMSASADLREIERAEKMKAVVAREAFRLCLRDLIVRMRQRFQSVLKGFTPAQQAALTKLWNDSVDDIARRDHGGKLNRVGSRR